MEAPPNKDLTEMNEVVDEVGLWQKRSSCLTKFAGLLGTKPSSPGAQDLASGPRVKAQRSLLSDSLEDHDVALTLPSLDLGLTELRDDSKSSILPVIGEHRDDPTTSRDDDPFPTMAASVLTSATDGAANSELKAAQNIGKITSWTKSTLEYAPDAVKKNVSNSFASLVDSRVRAWTLLLLRHSLSTGDDESRSRLLSMLASSIKMDSAETSFKTLPLPDAAAEQSKDNGVILPLLFEVVLHATVQEKQESVTLRAPGTVTGQFDPKSTSMKSVAVSLTSAALLNSMVEQARMIVLKTVATATKTQVPTAESIVAQSSSNPAAPSVPSVSAGSTANLAGFRSALTLNSAASGKREEPQSLLKARSSALRLSGVLHHKADSPTASLGIRKIRSVKWETPVQPPKLGGALAPSPKKPRKAINASKLKSFKSFGRPHAGDFGSGPRNATFAEFDRGQTWGRNGRLAHHPMPMQSSGGGSKTDLMGGMLHSADKNATFDLSATAGAHNLQVPRGHLHLAGASSSGLSSSAASARQRLQIPRTTTALEMFVLKKSTSGGKVMNS